VLRQVTEGRVRVKTDIKASPTGFPFKVANIEGTISEAETYEARKRVCDLGYLREAYRKENGAIGYRCPSEPVEDYVRKGGKVEDTVGRKCLCNGLVAGIGLGQKRKDGHDELPLVTSGDDLVFLSPLISRETYSYSAKDVLNYLLNT
jgi:NAD(P)H-dependent flavin oxidoreductase YrpB (nitropropane dioxygenase family)